MDFQNVPMQFTQNTMASPYDPHAMGQGNTGFYQNSNNMYQPQFQYQQDVGFGEEADEFASEPPLLEELEINIKEIRHKAMLAVNVFSKGDTHILDNTDMAGPVFVILLFGLCLMLAGKMNFGYIYGIALIGCLAFYALISLMSPKGCSLIQVCSVLGYCLIPMTVLSSLSIIASLKSSPIGQLSVLFTVLWCTWSSSKMFTYGLDMFSQRALLIYPCFLVYSVFALMVIY